MVHQGRLDQLLSGGRIEITADNVSEELSSKFRTEDSTVSFKAGRLIADVPDSMKTGEVIDAIRSAGGDVVSIIPRRKRLEDLFLESVAGDNVVKGRKLSKMTDDHDDHVGSVGAEVKDEEVSS
jgi:ABC-2 type transport system ATP-binding protein